MQIGRSSEAPIDFVVMDTVPGDKTGETRVMQSTISRFACRILCDRKNPKIARIYAAGFDTSKNIFLGVRNFTLIFPENTVGTSAESEPPLYPPHANPSNIPITHAP